MNGNDEGIEKVIRADGKDSIFTRGSIHDSLTQPFAGKYAFFMESSTIQYTTERNCKVTQIGGPLDNKV